MGATLFWTGLEAGFFFGLKDLDFDFGFTGWDFYANSFESTTLIYEGLMGSVGRKTFLDFWSFSNFLDMISLSLSICILILFLSSKINALYYLFID